MLSQSHWEGGHLQQFIVFQVLHTLDTQVVPRNTAQVLLVAPHQLKVRHTKMILLFNFIILVLILLYPQCRCFNCLKTFPKAIYDIQIKKYSYLPEFFRDRKTTSSFATVWHVVPYQKRIKHWINQSVSSSGVLTNNQSVI